MIKKIFFLLFSLDLGGVEKSLINLLASPEYQNKEIHIGLIKKQGELLKELPNNVTIHECCQNIWDEINLPAMKIIKKKFINGDLKDAGIHSLLYLYYKLSGDNSKYYYYILRKEKCIDIEFDEAYAYAGPASIIDFYIINKIKAKKKGGWIHYDIRKIGLDSRLIRKLYPNFDKINIVSKEAKLIFDTQFPALKTKTEVKHNIINCHRIKELAETGETFEDGFEGKRILTVGRISKEKGQDIAIKSLKRLIDKGYKVRWYFIGEGNFREECEILADELELTSHVCFLGAKSNPYHFMKDCNIYVQPSRYEGYCLTLIEARCFDIPIVATNVTGASEQLSNHIKKDLTQANSESLGDSILKMLNE